MSKSARQLLRDYLGTALLLFVIVGSRLARGRARIDSVACPRPSVAGVAGTSVVLYAGMAKR